MPDIRRINEEWLDHVLRKFRGEELFIGVIIPRDERYRSEITEILERHLDGYECIRRVDGITQTAIARFIGDNGNEIVVCQHDYYSSNLRLQRIANLVLCDELNDDINNEARDAYLNIYNYTILAGEIEGNILYEYAPVSTGLDVEFRNDTDICLDEWVFPEQRDLTQTEFNRIVDTFNNIGNTTTFADTYDFTAIHDLRTTHEPYWVFRLPDDEEETEELNESETLDDYIKSLAKMKT